MKLRRNLFTDVPPSYVDNITAHVVPEVGFDTKVEKESYRIKVFFFFIKMQGLKCAILFSLAENIFLLLVLLCSLYSCLIPNSPMLLLYVNAR